MKRYKKILPSTLALIMLTSSVTTSNVFAETLNENSGAETDSTGEPVTEEAAKEENVTEGTVTEGTGTKITTGSAINIVPKESIKPRITFGETVTDVENGWKYTYDVFGGGFVVKSTAPKTGVVTIPDKVEFGGTKYNVTAIESNCFKGYEELTKVILPSSMMFIGANAFEGCTSLEEIEMSSNLATIGSSAFMNCSALKKVVIDGGNSLAISEAAFAGCTSLREITLPNSMQSIANNVFENSGLLYIKIPGTMTYDINKNVFGSGTTTPEAKSLYTHDSVENTATSAYVEMPNVEDNIVSINPLPNDDFKGKTLYMKYNVTPNIDLVLDGATMGDDKVFPAWITGEDLEADLLGEFLSIPQKEGYKFDGWEVVSAETLNKDNKDYLIGSVKLKAKWEKDSEKWKEVIFDFNDGIGTKQTIDQMFGLFFNLPTVSERQGFTFLGWFDDNNVQITAATVVGELVDGTVFRAKWGRTVKFDFADVTTPSKQETQVVGEKFKLPAVPARDGFDFKGWYDGTTMIDENAIVGNSGDGAINLIAKWEPKEDPTDGTDTDNGGNDNNSGDGGNDNNSGDGGNDNNSGDGGNNNNSGDGGNDNNSGDGGNDNNSGDGGNDNNSGDGGNDNNSGDGGNDNNSGNGGNNNNSGNGGNNNNSGNGGNDNNSGNVGNANNNSNGDVGPSKILFNRFSVKADSNEFVTTYTDGSVKRTYAYNKTYIDPKTKSMYVSLRGVIDNSIDKVTIKWNPKTNTAEVNFTDKGTKIVFTANSSIMTVNGVERQMLSAEGEPIDAQLDNGRLMIPLRFVSELFDFNVKYDNKEKNSVVYTSRVEM